MALPLPRPYRNKEIMLRALEGASVEVIADAVDLSVETVRGILNSQLVKDEIARLQNLRAQEINQTIKQKSFEALETVTDTMRGELSSELRFKAAKDILDRNLDLKPKDSALRDLGEGVGESILRMLARKRAEQEEANEPIGTSKDSGSPNREVRDEGGTSGVERVLLEGDGHRTGRPHADTLGESFTDARRRETTTGDREAVGQSTGAGR